MNAHGPEGKAQIPPPIVDRLTNGESSARDVGLHCLTAVRTGNLVGRLKMRSLDSQVTTSLLSHGGMGV
jgi:hypothetical protein